MRFNSGGSGAFVSRDGLIVTNHHVAGDALQKMSTSAKDYYKDGFLARTRAEEFKAPDLELNVLVDIADVTDRVNAVVAAGMDDAAAAKARRQAMAGIEKASFDRTGLRSDVVTLYRGGRYHLYTYRKYTDVRLVFAPERAIASFGGDPDNFEFPRYDLDVAFFRAYQDGRPARPAAYLEWSGRATKEGDLVFVAGNPGSTSRLNTVAHLEYLRDVALPLSLSLLQDREESLQAYGRRGAEALRQSQQDLYGIQNSRKALLGRLAGLRDPALIERKARAERALRDRIAADPHRAAAYGPAWDRIAGSLDVARRNGRALMFLERGSAFDSALFGIARTIVRLVEEDAKPNAERLREYGDAARGSLEQALYSPAPIYPEYEEARLARSLAFWRRTMGESDPIVARVLDGRTPEDVARDLGARLAPGRRRGPQGAGAGRPGGGRGLGRPDDPAGPRRRRRGPRRPQGLRGPGRRRPGAAVCPHRQGPVRGPGDLGLPRCDLHAPPGLRRGEGLRGRRPVACPPTPRSAARSATPPRMATPIRTGSRRAGSRPAPPAGSTSTRP